MEISDQLLCLFSAQVEQRDGSSVIEIPERELQRGEIDNGRTYRVALLATPTEPTEPTDAEPKRERGPPEPPVEEGELREVDIEDIGDQGDGIARVERGFVVVVPDTERGERVTVEITDVRENVAFAEVVDRQTHF